MVTFLAVVALLLLPAFGSAARPDVVIFLADDFSQLDSSPYGARDMRTPNIQRLADRGMTFTSAYVASPSCAPSRAALLTGLMPARNGAEWNHARPRKEIKKWPAYFQDLGYEVVAFGKVSHYKHTADYGFDSFAHDAFHEHAAIPAAADFLKKRDREPTRPLCMIVGSNWPHVPWPEETRGIDPRKLNLPEGSVDTTATRKWRAKYAAAVAKADEDLGTVYDAARSTLDPKTIFLFSSDHGTQWPFAKWNLYEAGIKVPLIVEWPGVIKPQARTDAMVTWVDFLPTLLEAVGGEAPKDIDGRSFMSVLRGASDKHQDTVFATHEGDGKFNIYPARSVRQGTWKYIRNLFPEFAFASHIDLTGDLGQRPYWSTWEAAAKTDAEAAAIVKRYHARPAEELYDLAGDPHEQQNIANNPQHAERLADLRGRLNEWMTEQGDTPTTPPHPRLLSDPTSFGPGAAKQNPAAGAKKQAPR